MFTSVIIATNSCQSNDLPSKQALVPITIDQVDPSINGAEPTLFIFCKEIETGKCRPTTPKTPIQRMQLSSEIDNRSEEKVVLPLLTFYFKPGQSNLSTSDKNRIIQHFSILKNQKMMIIGYSDHTGGKIQNEFIAKLRAESIKTFLKDNGFSSGDIILQSKPKCCKTRFSKNNKRPSSKDRRAEILLLSNH